jgi:hypothetical protein
MGIGIIITIGLAGGVVIGIATGVVTSIIIDACLDINDIY